MAPACSMMPFYHFAESTCTLSRYMSVLAFLQLSSAEKLQVLISCNLVALISHHNSGIINIDTLILRSEISTVLLIRWALICKKIVTIMMKGCVNFRLQYSVNLMNSLTSHDVMTLVSLEKVTALLVSQANPLNSKLVLSDLITFLWKSKAKAVHTSQN